MTTPYWQDWLLPELCRHTHRANSSGCMFLSAAAGSVGACCWFGCCWLGWLLLARPLPGPSVLLLARLQ